MRLVGVQLAGEDEEIFFNPEHVIDVRKAGDTHTINIFASGSPHQTFEVARDVASVRQKLIQAEGEGR